MSETVSKTQIVIVEDNAEANNLYQEWLKLKFTVTGYLDAESALRQLQPSDDKIVFVLDFNLPGKNGLVLKQELKLLFPQAKFILISGLFDERLTEEAKAVGFDGLLPKPFAMPMLTRKVEDLLGVDRKENLQDFVKRQTS